MRHGKDHEPVVLLSPNGRLQRETSEEYLFEEVVRGPAPPAGKRRRLRCSKRAIYKKRRRAACLVIGLLVMLAVGVPIFVNHADRTDNEPTYRVTAPINEWAPQTMTGDLADKVEASEEESAVEPGTVIPPDDPTLYLTVPRLGLYGHTVRNDDSEAVLDLGAIKLPRTGFPWEEGSNTYIACHRLGFSGNESFNQCLNLPSMRTGDSIFLEDANGASYEYRVTEALVVEPEDTWVTDQIPGQNTVSLQTCVESLDDPHTLGPNWSARFVVQAALTDKAPSNGFDKLLGNPTTTYAGFLHTPSFSQHLESGLNAAKRFGRSTEFLFSRMSRVPFWARS